MNKVLAVMSCAFLGAAVSWPCEVFAGCNVDPDGDGAYSPDPTPNPYPPGSGGSCESFEDPFPDNPNISRPDRECDDVANPDAGIITDGFCGKAPHNDEADTCRPGDPVDLTTGGVSIGPITDLELKYPTYTYRFTRTYNSLLTNNAYVVHTPPGTTPTGDEFPMGYAWTFDGSETLVLETAPQEQCGAGWSGTCVRRVRFREGNGNAYWFTVGGSSYSSGAGPLFTPPEGGAWTLELSTDNGGSYTATPPINTAKTLDIVNVPGAADHRLRLTRVHDGKRYIFMRDQGLGWRLEKTMEGPGTVLYSAFGGEWATQVVHVGSIPVAKVCLRLEYPTNETHKPRLYEIRYTGPDGTCAAATIHGTYEYDTQNRLTSVPLGSLMRYNYEYSNGPVGSGQAQRITKAWMGDGASSTINLAGQAFHQNGYFVEQHDYAGGRVLNNFSGYNSFNVAYGFADPISLRTDDPDKSTTGFTSVNRIDGAIGYPSSKVYWDGNRSYVGSNNSEARCASAARISLSVAGANFHPGAAVDIFGAPVECVGTVDSACTSSRSRNRPLSNGNSAPRVAALNNICASSAMAYDNRPRFLPWRDFAHGDLATVFGALRVVGDKAAYDRCGVLGRAHFAADAFDHHGRPLRRWQMTRGTLAGIDSVDIQSLAGAALWQYPDEKLEYLNSNDAHIEPESVVKKVSWPSVLHSIQQAGSFDPLREAWVSRNFSNGRYSLDTGEERRGLTCVGGTGAQCTPQLATFSTSKTLDGDLGCKTFATKTVSGPRSGMSTSQFYYDVNLVSSTCASGVTSTTVPTLRARLGRTSVFTGGTSLVTDVQSYDVFGNPKLVVGPNSGERRLYVWDALGRLKASVDPQGGVTGYCYLQGSGLLASIRYPEGNYQSMLHDGWGRVLKVTNYSWGTGQASPSSCSPASFNEASCSADANNWNPCSMQAANDLLNQPWAERTVYTYASEGKVKTLTHESPTSSVLRAVNTYANSASRLSETQTGGTVKFETYDAAGNLTKKKDQLGNFTHYSYDAWSRLLDQMETNPSGTVISRSRFQYDHRGNLRVVQTCRTQVCLSALPAFGAALQPCAMYPNTQESNQSCPVGEPDSLVTYYRYDDFGRLLSVDSPDSGFTRYEYDASDNVRFRFQYVDRNASTPLSQVEYVYDLANRVVQSRTITGGTTTTEENFSYEQYGDGTTPANASGRLVEVTAGSSDMLRKRWTYDVGGRVASESQEFVGSGSAATVCYSYDRNGAVTGMTYPSSVALAITRDAARLHDMHYKVLTPGFAFWQNLAVNYTFQPGGGYVGYQPLPSPSSGNQVTATRNVWGSLASITNVPWVASGATATFVYGVDGHINDAYNQYDTVHGKIHRKRYWYHPFQRLDFVEHYDSSNVRYFRDAFQLDANHNRTSRTRILNGVTKNLTYTAYHSYADGSQQRTTNRIAFVQDPVEATGNHTVPPVGCPLGGAVEVLLDDDVVQMVGPEDWTREVQIPPNTSVCVEVLEADAAAADVWMDGEHILRAGDFMGEQTGPIVQVSTWGGVHTLSGRIHGPTGSLVRIRVAVPATGAAPSAPASSSTGSGGPHGAAFPDGLAANSHAADALDDEGGPELNARKIFALAIGLMDLLKARAHGDTTVDENAVQRARTRFVRGIEREAERLGVPPMTVVARLDANPAFTRVFDLLMFRAVADAELWPNAQEMADYDPSVADLGGMSMASVMSCPMVPANPLLRYRYDGRGNVTEIQPVEAQSDTAKPTGRGICFDYDSRGRLIRQGATTVDATACVFYDCKGRWLSTDPDRTNNPTYGPWKPWLYRYDERNLRVAKMFNGSLSTRYMYDQQGRLIAELGPTGQFRREYVYAQGEPLTLMTYPTGYPTSGQATLNFFFNDQLGTPQVVTSSTKVVRWAAFYEGYLGAKVAEDVDADGVNLQNNLRAPGQYSDPEMAWTDLVVGAPFHYNWNRFYNPQDGRYLQPDPVLFEHPYAYARNAPATFIDDTGLTPVLPDKDAERPDKGWPWKNPDNGRRGPGYVDVQLDDKVCRCKLYPGSRQPNGATRDAYDFIGARLTEDGACGCKCMCSYAGGLKMPGTNPGSNTIGKEPGECRRSPGCIGCGPAPSGGPG